jgi:hypothetical protein
MPNLRRYLSISLIVSLALAPLSGTAQATPVPPDVQQRVITIFSDSLVLPDTAEWRFESFEPFPGGGNVACGVVNYQDSTKVYIGWRGFYAVVRGPNITTRAILPRYKRQDPTGGALYDYTLLCHHAPPPAP